MKCTNKSELEQAPWALIHVDGHMADVPWHFLAHQKDGKGVPNQQQCRADWNEPYLRLIDKGASGRQLRCERCKATSDFGDGLQIPYGKTRQQPWIKEDADATDRMATVLEINDARVHAPQTRNALVIPPESRIRKGSVFKFPKAEADRTGEISGCKKGRVNHDRKRFALFRHADRRCPERDQ